ncbi:hypothetical protein [Paenibacillus sp. FSL R10-2736]|uniref:hypothetical protein n=1 Tax=Paenibacillus sp. FSL R10-2736 TaxID=2954692 RepID=UPI0030F54E59
MDQIHAKRYFYNFIKNKQDALSIINFEQWVYEHDELEDIFGEKEYLELISRDYKDKFAYHETEKQIRRLVNFGLFEQERITNMLNDLLINEAKSDKLEILGILYEEYCSGYNFLRYIALSYILTSDEYKGTIKVNQSKFEIYIDGIKKEAVRLLGFLRSNEILIDDEYEYSDYRTEKDQIELHSINEMLGAN